MSKQHSVIKPTVGRKLWYRPCAHELTGLGAMTASPGQPLDATVVAVWGDRCVNVQVLDVQGKAYTKMSVTLKQAGDQMPADKDGNEVGGYVEWMPYQQGQAAKAEAVDEGATTG
ncbi:MAG: hypothetical protein K2W93_21950 [Burkholderiaceae bacterium]|nr:hypothetical protein [Burkholderiaceae bacterium]